jgi:hypothetical protein
MIIERQVKDAPPHEGRENEERKKREELRPTGALRDRFRAIIATNRHQ